LKSIIQLLYSYWTTGVRFLAGAGILFCSPPRQAGSAVHLT